MSIVTDAQKPTLVWVDGTNIETQASAIAEECGFEKNYKTFKSPNQFKEYFDTQPDTTRIILIITGGFGKELVPTIQSSPKILEIYVFCGNKALHEQWTIEYQKIKLVCTDPQELRCEISRSLSNVNSMGPTEGSVTTKIPQKTRQIKASYIVDAQYMTSDCIFDSINRMTTVETDKNDFLKFFQETFKSDMKLTEMMKIFQESYSSDKAISWLYRDSFFNAFLSNALNTANMDAMYVCRFLIHDVYKQIEQNKCQTTVHVFHSELMTNDEFQDLQKFNGRIIAMKTFFSAYTDREKALQTASISTASNENKHILYVIEANPEISKTKPFGEVEVQSNNQNLGNIHFMIGSLFRIDEIENEKDGVINVKMTLSNNVETDARTEFYENLKKEFIYNESEKTHHHLCELIIKIVEYENCPSIYGLCLMIFESFVNKLPNDDSERDKYYKILALSNNSISNYGDSIRWYEKLFQSLTAKKVNENDQQFIDIYSNMASIYHQVRDYKNAIVCYKKMLICTEANGDDNLCVTIHKAIAGIYYDEKKFGEALTCYHKALETVHKNGVANEIKADIYYCIGNCYGTFNEFRISLGFHTESLALNSTRYQGSHPSLANSHKMIGHVYGCMKENEKAREHYEKAKAMFRELFPNDDRCVVEVEQFMKKLSD